MNKVKQHIKRIIFYTLFMAGLLAITNGVVEMAKNCQFFQSKSITLYNQAEASKLASDERTAEKGVDDQLCGLKEVVCENETPAGVEKMIRHYAINSSFSDPDLLVALSKGESGLVKDRVSEPNSNGTLDVGAFQINDCQVCDWQIKKYGKAKEGCINSEDRKNLKLATEWTINKIRAGGLGIWVYARKAGLQFNG